MFIAIQKIKTGEHIEQQETEYGVIDVVVSEYSDHLAFVAETKEQLEKDDFITYDRIEEYEYAEMYNGVIYTDRTECTNAKNESIKKIREKLYLVEVDPLHAQKTKDVIMGEWSDEKEQEYIAKVKELTIKIRDENPYIDIE